MNQLDELIGLLEAIEEEQEKISRLHAISERLVEQLCFAIDRAMETKQAA